MQWLASTLKKPFSSYSDESDDDDGATTSTMSNNNSNSGQRNRSNFWKRSPVKRPGSVKQVRASNTKSSNVVSVGVSESTELSPQVNAQDNDNTPVDSVEVVTERTDESSIVVKDEEEVSNEIEANSLERPVSNGDGSGIEESYASKIAERKRQARQQRFLELLEADTIDMDHLRKLSWSGIDTELRGSVWQVLLGYLPANSKRRQATLVKRRKEYVNYLSQFYEIKDNQRSESDSNILRQIRLDVPRTCPGLKLFQIDSIQQSFERILYIWAVRHPASGYVQGINDLATPFFIVFLTGVTGMDLDHIETWDIDTINRITPDQYMVIEADSFWCLTKLLDGIQDHYTFAQPGIQRMVFHLQELISRIDEPLHTHLAAQDVHFLQFAFRWMNCLLLREISLPLVIRAWDTYLSEPDDTGFKEFHVYVCAAFLCHWSSTLQSLDFQDLVVFLQNLPTENWGIQQIETILSQAFVYQSLFHGSPKHLQ